MKQKEVKKKISVKAETEEKIRKSLSISITEGSFWSVMIGLGEKYLSAFAVFLKATNTQLGLLSSLPQLLSSLSRLLSPRLIEIFKTRKKFVASVIFIQALSWLLILTVFFLGKYRVYYLILFVTIYWITGSIDYPAWNSWMGDLVKSEQKGAYFSKRTKIISLIIFIATVIGGLILDLFRNGAEKQYLGFAAIFLVAMLSRLVSTFLITRQYEPKMVKTQKEDKFSFIEFLKEAPHRNYGLFTLFLTLMNFCIFISAPFFAAYMLYDLKLSYTQYMIILSASLIAKYITFPAWGKLSDHYGNRKILGFSCALVPIIPLLWVFSTNFYYLIIAELFSGFVWAGIDLASFNFVFDTTTPEKRARCVSYYNVLNGIMIFAGTMVGSFIINHNNLFWSKYLLVFIISSVTRFFVVAIFIPKIKERRQVEQISYDQIAIKATNLIISEGYNNVSSIVSYPRKFFRWH